MNILILNWKDIKNPDRGGAEVIAHEFSRRLVTEGHTVTFFSRRFPNCKTIESIDGVRIVRKGNLLSVYLHAWFYYLRLKTKPDRVIDMVNTICWQTPLYVPKKNRIMYVNQLAKEVFFYELPWFLSWFAYLLERFEYLSYKNTKILCYSKSTRQDLSAWGMSAKNIHLFSMGLDHQRYSPSFIKSKDPLFFFLARLVKMKRADLCIQAMQELIKKYPKAKLIIMGNGPDENRIRSLVNDLALEKNVEFITHNNFFKDKTNKDIRISLLQQSWALVLPSVKEGWGMVVTEAAACGTPAIVSNVTGLRDSVVDKKTGLILPKDPTPQELAASMIQVIKDNDLREKLSKEAIKWSKNFTWDKSYEGFKKILLTNTV